MSSSSARKTSRPTPRPWNATAIQSPCGRPAWIEVRAERLPSRGRDSDPGIAARMREARRGASHYVECDYLVVNRDFDRALAEMRAIVAAERARRERRAAQLGTLLHDLTMESDGVNR